MMQGVLCMPPENFTSEYHSQDKTDEHTMDMTAPTSITKEINQSDSGIFSATANTTNYQEDQDCTNVNAHSDSDQRSDEASAQEEDDSDHKSYLCPICETMLTSQHQFTLHIRSHNNENNSSSLETISSADSKTYTCRICKKILSSSSSLDRHVLVHSGERPFTCKHCGDTFTTNGNMHRHMRTHKNPGYESDASVESTSSASSKSTEYNNNKIEKRKAEDILCHNVIKKPHLDEVVRCPVCDRDDFTNAKSLELHLEDNHPDYPAKCHYCNQLFPNNKLLNYHKNTVHVSDDNGRIKPSVIGFKDLTFVDFSSDKFPVIARAECEKAIHKVATGLKFQCSKCVRAFPCEKSLQIHLQDCGTFEPNSRNEDRVLFGTELRRADFFSGLHLQDNSPEKILKRQPAFPNPYESPPKPRLALDALKVMDGPKDLADIQTIISMTSNENLLQHLKSKASDIDKNCDDRTEEEETQDIFAQEFRKMKLRGEFPCRLCTAIFPNLRALKGHNRIHLNSTTNGTYRCNMCPHSSIDKAALIRHMRTHNGDRPYECSICNYAFTTKANCERHLRNRHAKSTREEVKKSIIYHPNEDPTNEDIAKSIDTKKMNTSMERDVSTPDKIRSSTPKAPSLPVFPEMPIKTPDFGPLLPMHMPKPAYSNINEILHNESLKTMKERSELLSPYVAAPLQFTPPEFSSTSTPQKPKIQVKNLTSLKAIPEYDQESESEPDELIDDEPMDLVLDLSKKKPDDYKSVDDIPEDLSKKIDEPPPTSHVSEILAQQLLKNSPKVDPASIYASQLAFYNSRFPGLPNWPGFPLNPLLFQGISQPLLTAHDPHDMKERLQRLQLCGGSMIDFAERLRQYTSPPSGFQNYTKQLEASKPEVVFSPKPQEEMQPLTISVEPPVSYNEPGVKLHSPVVPGQKQDMLQSPNSVKMVIKNGVLMPKQKQRRYRTERPFSCEHCSARFTLRSNMERHIKQQHPQYWSQRQRSSSGNPGRKPQIIASTMKNSLCDLNVPNYEVLSHKIHDYDDSKDTKTISEKLKYAILAQHLRGSGQIDKPAEKMTKDEDDDCALIIDENGENENSRGESGFGKSRILEEKLKELRVKQLSTDLKKSDEAHDLVPVSRLLDNANQQPFKDYFRREVDEPDVEPQSEEEEEGLVASGSTSEGNSGTDENRSESDNAPGCLPGMTKKKSAYSLAPNRVSCPYCSRKFPWTSSLRRHILTHTGQKPFKCSHCPLLFTTKSNCDRHLLRKHGNSATTIANQDGSSNNPNFLMRNVPERPFKCSHCPSSTFSTYSNLKKHMIGKHGAQDDRQGYEAGSSEDEKNHSDQKNSDWETQVNHAKPYHHHQTGDGPSSADLPFKCHLCDCSFSDRDECLSHIKDKHNSEYDLLLSKNALDLNAVTPDDVTPAIPDDDDLDYKESRGKFPDYSNRKVICAFCMRRFWSAEDLRRHMRTHTGERPFSCDICRRRFTLKHSMLRHRKKHTSSKSTFESDNVQSDDDNISPPTGESDDGVVHKTSDIPDLKKSKTDESDNNESGDLISNLLGIRDKNILDQMLTSSADDAAKLLGVGKEN